MKKKDTDNKNLKLAILIDADNASPTKILDCVILNTRLIMDKKNLKSQKLLILRY